MLVSCHSLVGRATTWHEILISLCILYTLMPHSSLLLLLLLILSLFNISGRTSYTQLDSYIYFSYLFVLLAGPVSESPGGRHSFRGPTLHLSSSNLNRSSKTVRVTRQLSPSSVSLFLSSSRPNGAYITFFYNYAQNSWSTFRPIFIITVAFWRSGRPRRDRYIIQQNYSCDFSVASADPFRYRMYMYNLLMQEQHSCFCREHRQTWQKRLNLQWFFFPLRRATKSCQVINEGKLVIKRFIKAPQNRI